MSFLVCVGCASVLEATHGQLVDLLAQNGPLNRVQHNPSE